MHVNEEYFWREICKHEPKMNLLYRRRKIGRQDISKYYDPQFLGGGSRFAFSHFCAFVMTSLSFQFNKKKINNSIYLQSLQTGDGKVADVFRWKLTEKSCFK